VGVRAVEDHASLKELVEQWEVVVGPELQVKLQLLMEDHSKRKEVVVVSRLGCLGCYHHCCYCLCCWHQHFESGYEPRCFCCCCW
jgi:hypothetical protein